jgi:hypothetical protein
VGASDSIDGAARYCLWIGDGDANAAARLKPVAERLARVRSFRLASSKAATVMAAQWPHRFQEIRQPGSREGNGAAIVVIPRHSSEHRDWLPFSVAEPGAIVADSAAAFYDAPLWNVALFASRLHLVWVAAVCGKIKTDYRYSITLGWNTFPVPPLTASDKAGLTRCAEAVAQARAAHAPATIAELYGPGRMPADLRAAHARNDAALERLYIGRPFRDDTERLETLFGLYAGMTAS